MSLNYGKNDWISQATIAVILLLISMICIYPIVYVLSMSISDAKRIALERLWLLPKGFSLQGYIALFTKNPSIWRTYGNTIFYTTAGTAISVILTTMLGYVLSRKDFWGGKVLIFLVTFTMLFSGGLIPTFLIVLNLGLYNTIWAILLPNSIVVWNTLITRTFFQGLPYSLTESAKLDGANDLIILTRIILPISQPIIAVLSVFYAVEYWNSYLPALLYLTNRDLFPLQLFLAKFLISGESMLSGGEVGLDKQYIQYQLKYVAIMITILPIIMIYPFFQKYFVKGVTMGAIKG